MKVGDLVKVNPARENLYLIVGDFPEPESSSMGKLWNLYSADGGWSLPMYEKWLVPF